MAMVIDLPEVDKPACALNSSLFPRGGRATISLDARRRRELTFRLR